MPKENPLPPGWDYSRNRPLRRACDHRNPPRDQLGRCMICWPGGTPGGVQRATDAQINDMFEDRIRVDTREYIRRKNVINAIKTQLLNLERLDLDEMVGLASQGRTLEAEYAHLNTEAPDWLTDGLKALRRDIREKLADTKQRRLLEARAKLSNLASPEERRAKLAQEIADLERDLGIEQVSSK